VLVALAASIALVAIYAYYAGCEIAGYLGYTVVERVKRNTAFILGLTAGVICLSGLLGSAILKVQRGRCWVLALVVGIGSVTTGYFLLEPADALAQAAASRLCRYDRHRSAQVLLHSHGLSLPAAIESESMSRLQRESELIILSLQTMLTRGWDYRISLESQQSLESTKEAAVRTLIDCGFTTYSVKRAKDQQLLIAGDGGDVFVLFRLSEYEPEYAPPDLQFSLQGNLTIWDSYAADARKAFQSETTMIRIDRP
jgi:hypothetical protein